MLYESMEVELGLSTFVNVRCKIYPKDLPQRMNKYEKCTIYVFLLSHIVTIVRPGGIAGGNGAVSLGGSLMAPLLWSRSSALLSPPGMAPFYMAVRLPPKPTALPPLATPLVWPAASLSLAVCLQRLAFKASLPLNTKLLFSHYGQ